MLCLNLGVFRTCAEVAFCCLKLRFTCEWENALITTLAYVVFFCHLEPVIFFSNQEDVIVCSVMTLIQSLMADG